MAVIQLPTSDWTWYIAGQVANSSIVGYDGTRRVGRFQFQAPSTGASGVLVTYYTGGRGEGSYIPMRFYIGTDPESHRNAGVEYEYTGTLSLDSEYLTFTGSAEIVLTPDTTYYLWVFPGEDKYGWFRGYRPNYTSTIETLGAAESTIGATDATIESRALVVVTRNSTDLTHSIRYEFGELSGYLNADGSVSSTEVKMSATSIAFLLPKEFYTQIPNAKTGLCKLTCVTYSGEEPVGSARTSEFTVTASPELCSPVVSGSVQDNLDFTKELTGDSNVLIRFCSQALCTIQCQAKNYATIVSKRIGGELVSEDTRLIDNIEVSSVTFEVVDSRGYVASVVVPCTVIEYIKLTGNFVLKRTDPTSGDATLSIRGDYFDGSLGVVDNTLTAKYRLAQGWSDYGEYQDVELSIQDNKYSATVPLSGLDYEQEYKAQVLVYDKLYRVEKVAPVGRGIPSFDWGENDFRFNIPVCIPTTMYGATPPDSAKKGQMFFQLNDDGTYSLRIYSGSSWS